MLSSVAWELRCDEPGCDTCMNNAHSPFRLRDDGRAEGWQFNVKLNGEQALRGGKDYCPQHNKPAEVSR